MKKILRYKSDIIAYISCILMVVGTILPIINIDGTTKAFIIENGKLVLICAVIAAMLYVFKLGFFSFLPAIASLLVILFFYNGINDSIKYLNELSPNSAFYEIGFYLIIIASVILLFSSIINYIDTKKYGKIELPKKSKIIKTEIRSNDIDVNIKPSLNIVEPIIQESKNDFIICPHCGAKVSKNKTRCIFCDGILTNNKI